MRAAGAGPAQKRTEPAAPEKVRQQPSWPNGSAVFAHLAEAGRVELGRVVRDGEKWRIWRRRGDEYRKQGTAASQSAAILSLLEIAAPAPPARRSKEAAMAATSSAAARTRLPPPGKRSARMKA